MLRGDLGRQPSHQIDYHEGPPEKRLQLRDPIGKDARSFVVPADPFDPGTSPSFPLDLKLYSFVSAFIAVEVDPALTIRRRPS